MLFENDASIPLNLTECFDQDPDIDNERIACDLWAGVKAELSAVWTWKELLLQTER
jgi:hypothetical protein